MSTHVTRFYKDKSIFLTGGTGFVGICLIEKLLRCCPDLDCIYVLVRAKKGKQITERLEDLTKNAIFDRLREEKQDHLFSKLTAIEGDVSKEELGLSEEDKATLKNKVQIVVHSAATLDFEADLRTTTNINLLGTMKVVELCREIKNLQALVHISTAYVNIKLYKVDEKLYPAPIDRHDFLKLIEGMDDATLKAQTSEILRGHANPYTFTKHLAEHEITRMPAAIVRPSMITAAWKEPVPGWTISKNGPQGFMMGASKGVVRRLPISELIYDYIPVDVVVNSIIVAAYEVDRDGNKEEVKVYHCTSSTCNPFKWKSIEKNINNYLHKYPLNSAVWYPHLKFVSSLFIFKIAAILFHFIPAYILDAVTTLCGGRRILVRLHTNVMNSLERLKLFIFTEWKFNNSRLLELHESLTPEDQELFTLDIRPLVWVDYFDDLTNGTRTYLSKESPKSLDKARFKQKILLIAHLSLQSTLLGLTWYLVKIAFATTWTKSSLVVPIIYMLFNQL